MSPSTYNETQDRFQIFMSLMKTSDTDAMCDVACFIYHALNLRKRLIDYISIIYIGPLAI